MRFRWMWYPTTAALALTGAVSAQAEPEDTPILRDAACVVEPDETLDFMLETLVGAAKIGPDGVLYLSSSVNKRFLEPGSGYYWQISAKGHEVFSSRSLWDRTLPITPSTRKTDVRYSELTQFDETPLRLAERLVTLPGSLIEWRFQVARPIDQALSACAQGDGR